MFKNLNYNLYFVTSQEYSRERDTLDIVRQAIVAGIDILQMREKYKERDELIALGDKLSALCRESGVTFIVNDDPNIAKECKADGVHLGQEDKEKFSIGVTRKILGKDKIIGLSTHSIDQVVESNNMDVDYIAFGPIFPTKTKNYNIGVDEVKLALELAQKPVFLIGGINLSNIEILLKFGAKNIAVIRAISEAANVEEKVERLKNIILKYKKCYKGQD